MSAMPVMPREHDWTVDDLQRLPDDGLQYELVDGVLLVSPAPTVQHQRMARQVFLLLHQACPPDLEVLYGPVDYQPDRRSSLQPDVLVMTREDTGERAVTLPLRLAVEVLSPSTRRKDLVLKHSRYADAGVASYWVVDPEGPSMTAWDLVAGRYVEVARAVGEQEARLQRPYAVTVVPARLLLG